MNASDSFLLRFSMMRSMQRKWLDVSIMSSTLTVSSFSTPIVLVSKMYVSGRRSDGCPQCCWSCRSAPPVTCDRYRLCNRYAFCPRVFQRGWMELSLLSRRTWAWSRSKGYPMSFRSETRHLCALVRSNSGRCVRTGSTALRLAIFHDINSFGGAE